MLAAEGMSLSDVEGTDFSYPWGGDLTGRGALWGHEGSGSGGYTHHIFKHAAEELFGQETGSLQYKQLR